MYQNDVNEIAKIALPLLQAQQSLHEFTRQAWHIIEPDTEFVSGWHIRAICEHLEAVSRGQIKRLMILVPPRTCKSTLTSVMWPAWDWLTTPGRKFLYGSHGNDISVRDSIRCRDIIESDWYQNRFGHIFSLNKNTEKYFDNTRRGFRKATSVNSSITGGDSHIIVGDDLNDTTDVFSDKIRAKTNLWFSGTLSMRLNDRKEGAIVLIMQRSHEVDVAGFILNSALSKNWTTLMLPMEFEPERRTKTISLGSSGKVWEDPRTKAGELLWPQRIGKDELQDLKLTLKTEYAIAGQLQQRPSPEAGGILKKSFFKWWKQPKPPKLKQVIQSWDTALTDEDMKNGAYSACTTWGLFDDFGEDEDHNSGIPNVILLDCWRGHLEYPELRKMMQRLAAHYKDKGEDYCEPDGNHVPDIILVEAKSSGMPLVQDLRRGGVYAIPFVPDDYGDKTNRVRLCTPIMECGRVWVPASPNNNYKTLLPFAEKFLEQCILFPNAEARDYVDSMSQTLLRLLYGGMLYHSSDPRSPRHTKRKLDNFYSP